MILLLTALSAAQEPGLSSGTFSVADDPRETVAQTRAEERNILDELMQLDLELQAIAAEVDSLRTRRAELEARQLQVADELSQAESRLTEHRREISAWLRMLYRLHRRGLARIMFSSEDPYELRRRSRYLAAIISADAQRLQAFSEAVESRTAAEAAVTAGMEQLNALGAQLQLKEEELRLQRTRKMTLLEDVRARRELAMRLISESSQARTNFGSQLSMGSSWYSDNSASTSRCTSQGAFRSQVGRLPWPVSGRIIRRFGSYTDPRSGRSERNDSLDIAADLGTPVTAVYGGVVRIAEPYLRLYGQVVAIAHGPYTTVYAHLSSIKVRVNQEICAGDVIGTVGDSGLTENDGYQLSFQVRYHDEPQDPLPWLQPGGAR